MASRAKPTGTTGRNAKRSQKPQTIDLDAKEVKSTAETKAEANKTSAAKSSTSSKTSASATATSKAADTKATSSSEGEKKSTSTAAPKTSNTPKLGRPSPEKDDKDVKPVPPKAAQEARRGGFGSALVGGVVTVLGLGVLGQFDSASKIPFIGSIYDQKTEVVDNSGNAAEIAALKSQIEEISNNQNSAPSNVDLGPLTERISKIEEAAAGQSDERIVGLESTIEDLNSKITAITSAVESGSDASTAEVTAALAAISSRMGDVENGVAELKEATSNGSSSEAIAEALAKVDALSAQVTELSSQEPVDLSPLQASIDDIAKSVASLGEKADANSAGLADVVGQIASVKVNEKVARSVAVNALGTALQNNDPLSIPIASIEALAGETPETKRLKELNEAGIPSTTELASGLDWITQTVQNPVADTSNGGVSDRLWANVQNLVTFRSRGPQEGDTPIAILSRVKAGVESGNLNAARNEWSALPASIRENDNGWIAKLDARAEALAIQKKLSDELNAAAG